MICIVKDIKIDGKWNTFETLRIQEDYTLYPLLCGYGTKVFSCKGMTAPSKVLYTFYRPKVVLFLRSSTISIMTVMHPEVEHILGSFPFDYPSVTEEKEDMLSLLDNYGISDFRMLSWRI